MAFLSGRHLPPLPSLGVTSRPGMLSSMMMIAAARHACRRAQGRAHATQFISSATPKANTRSLRCRFTCSRAGFASSLLTFWRRAIDGMRRATPSAFLLLSRRAYDDMSPDAGEYGTYQQSLPSCMRRAYFRWPSFTRLMPAYFHGGASLLSFSVKVLRRRQHRHFRRRPTTLSCRRASGQLAHAGISPLAPTPRLRFEPTWSTPVFIL